ncbi:group III truncated hemoglobin [Phenylobacterium sp. J367]|uniref:group III truncated hemoglobin n=1 Tax=Phenylobacterium sp. J367 TaxID=2898435 RepID=UPI002150A2D3|nr:group III truncated hemoglobin [Phenylobacterium sp. J367]MCR5879946.1 group III truncated hemoglobin [Phenylobacterium sp. J367]
MIHALVHGFYARVRADAVLEPIFGGLIADWDPHLDRMVDFWSSVMLMTGRFKGQPMAVHVRIPGLEGAHFERWLGLFRETAAEVCPAEAATAFVARAETIAQSFQLGIAHSRGELPPLKAPA